MSDELKNKANPNYELLQVNTDLLKEQVITNELLLANLKANKAVLQSKVDQKNGDIKFRKKSTLSSTVTISIALVALYISVVGVDSFY
jgi:uncharacterized protein YktA (UPF0223 family)